MSGLLEAISTSIGQLVNRAFITAGLVPAIISYGLLQAHLLGWGQLRAQIHEAFGEDFLALFGWELIVLIVLAWLFTALRTVVQAALAEVPIPLLRQVLIRVNLWCHRRQKGNELAWEARYTALDWHKDKEAFARFEPIVCEDANHTTIEDEEAATIAKASESARRVLGKRRFLWAWRVRKIADAVVRLRTVSRCTHIEKLHQKVVDELSIWRTFIRDPRKSRRLDEATEEANRQWDRATERLSAYPQDVVHIQPTRFGNRLAAITDYAKVRYGIDTRTLWVRLWGILPERAQKDVSQARESVDALVNISTALWLLAILVLVDEIREYIRIRAGPTEVDVTAILTMLAAALAAYAVYRASVMAMGRLADSMARWIDLQRLHIFPAIGLSDPARVSEEKELFEALQNFYGLEAWPLNNAWPLRRVPPEAE